MEPANQGEVPKLSQVIQIDEGKIQEHLEEVVRSTVTRGRVPTSSGCRRRRCRRLHFESMDLRPAAIAVERWQSRSVLSLPDWALSLAGDVGSKCAVAAANRKHLLRIRVRNHASERDKEPTRLPPTRGGDLPN